MHQSLKIPGVLSRCVTFIIVLLHKKSIESVSVQKNTNEVKYADENEAVVTVFSANRRDIGRFWRTVLIFQRGRSYEEKKFPRGLFKFFPDLADMVEHLIGIGSHPVIQVVFHLPEPALLIKMSDDITDEDIRGHRQSDDHG